MDDNAESVGIGKECGLRGHIQARIWCLLENAGRHPPSGITPAEYVHEFVADAQEEENYEDVKQAGAAVDHRAREIELMLCSCALSALLI